MNKKNPMRPSPFLIRVLASISEMTEKGVLTSPSFIANRVFPSDHPGWTRSCKCGAYGSTRGSGLVMMMGAYLGKLRRAEPALTERYWRDKIAHHHLTAEGQKLLKNNLNLLKDSQKEVNDETK